MSLSVGALASTEDLALFAESAGRDARRLVVGALITDGEGRIYLQRRSLGRALFPGSWDLVGGHAEEGEGVHAALTREVLEETGWRLRNLGPVVELIDWEEGGVKRREIDLLVGVDGDLEHPLLEAGKHDEGRWLTVSEAEKLAATAAKPAGPGDEEKPSAFDSNAWVFEVAARAFTLLQRMPDESP